MAKGRALLQATQATRGIHSATPLLPQLLERSWLLPKPDTHIQRVLGVDVIADDLLHPHIGGNKLRKFDALLPDLQEAGCTDVVGVLLSSVQPLLIYCRLMLCSLTSTDVAVLLPTYHKSWHSAGHVWRPAERALHCCRSAVRRTRLACAPACARGAAFHPSWVRVRKTRCHS